MKRQIDRTIAAMLLMGLSAPLLTARAATPALQSPPGPELKILAPVLPPQADVLNVSSPTLTVRVRVMAPAGQRCAVHVQANAQDLLAERAASDFQAAGGAEDEQDVPLHAGLNSLAIYAVDPTGRRSAIQTFVVSFDASRYRPSLYALFVGIGQYELPSLQLKFPAKDARDLAASFAAQKGKLFGDVHEDLLLDAAATRQGILDHLASLGRGAGPDDYVLLFLSGQGAAELDGHYSLITVNCHRDEMTEQCVNWDEILQVLGSKRGIKLLLVDTCRSAVSGAAAGVDGGGLPYQNALMAAFRKSVNTFASCSAGQRSLEGDDWGNSAFVRALIEGLDGRADAFGEGRVTMSDLSAYLSHRVVQLTAGKQTPTFDSSTRTPGSLPLALLDKPGRVTAVSGPAH